jgi:hypothetical protein
VTWYRWRWWRVAWTHRSDGAWCALDDRGYWVRLVRGLYVLTERNRFPPTGSGGTTDAPQGAGGGI